MSLARSICPPFISLGKGQCYPIHTYIRTNISVLVITAVCCCLQLVRFPTPRRREGKGEGKKSRRSKHKPNPEMPVGAPIFRKLKADEVVAEDEESITDVREGVRATV